jgi:hypothetical protein
MCIGQNQDLAGEQTLPTQNWRVSEVVGELNRLFRDASCSLRPDRRHGIASAHFMCPSKPSDVAMTR